MSNNFITKANKIEIKKELIEELLGDLDAVRNYLKNS